MPFPESLLAVRHLQGHHGKKGTPARVSKGTQFERKVEKVMSSQLKALKKNMTKAGLTRRFVNEADVRQMPEVIMETLCRIIEEDTKSENRMKAMELISKYTMIPSAEVVLEEGDTSTKQALEELASLINKQAD